VQVCEREFEMFMVQFEGGVQSTSHYLNRNADDKLYIHRNTQGLEIGVKFVKPGVAEYHIYPGAVASAGP